MHWLAIYGIWMLYALLCMGIVEAASDRTQDLRGAKAALWIGAGIGVSLSALILWFGPT